jgi:hypothetical protein
MEITIAIFLGACVATSGLLAYKRLQKDFQNIICEKNIEK